MDNFSKAGKVIQLTAPTGGVVSGTAYLIGSLLVIATETKAQTLAFSALVVGAVDVPKVADEAWTEGMKVYFDESEGKFTLDPDTAANPLVGVAIQPISAVSVSLASTALAADLLIDNAALTLQVLDYATLAGGTPPTVTVTIAGVDHVLTEGTDFTAETSDEVTATNLAAAIAALTGVTAVAVNDTVTVTPATGITAAQTSLGRVRLDGAVR